MHVATRSLDIGGAFHILVLFFRHTATISYHIVASHVATDVAATVNGAHVAVIDFDPCAVLHVTHLATAIEVVDQHIGAVHHHVGTIVYFLISRCHSFRCVGGDSYCSDLGAAEIVGYQTVVAELILECEAEIDDIGITGQRLDIGFGIADGAQVELIAAL